MNQERPGQMPNRQKIRTSKVIEVSNQFGLGFRTQQEIEFFFYADLANDAANLAIALHELGYAVEAVHKSEYGTRRWVITGWTQTMNTDEDGLSAWAEQMDLMAANHHAEFDGWGTFVE